MGIQIDEVVNEVDVSWGTSVESEHRLPKIANQDIVELLKVLSKEDSSLFNFDLSRASKIFIACASGCYKNTDKVPYNVNVMDKEIVGYQFENDLIDLSIRDVKDSDYSSKKTTYGIQVVMYFSSPKVTYDKGEKFLSVIESFYK